MNIVSAMAFLLEGQPITRLAWQGRPPGESGDYEVTRWLEPLGGHVGLSGERYVYGHSQSFGRSAYLDSDDMLADDWMVAPPAGHAALASSAPGSADGEMPDE